MSLIGVSVRSTGVARVPPEGFVVIVTHISNNELLSATIKREGIAKLAAIEIE